MTEVSIAQLLLPNGDLVMQRRDQNTKIAPGLLGFFGGHVEDGEAPDEAMKRELAEETSLDVTTLDITHLVTKEVPNPENKKEPKIKVHFYRTMIDSDDFKVYEGQQAETYSLPELIKRLDIAPTAKRMVAYLIVSGQ